MEFQCAKFIVVVIYYTVLVNPVLHTCNLLKVKDFKNLCVLFSFNKVDQLTTQKKQYISFSNCDSLFRLLDISVELDQDPCFFHSHDKSTFCYNWQTNIIYDHFA